MTTYPNTSRNSLHQIPSGKPLSPDHPAPGLKDPAGNLHLTKWSPRESPLPVDDSWPSDHLPQRNWPAAAEGTEATETLSPGTAGVFCGLLIGRSPDWRARLVFNRAHVSERWLAQVMQVIGTADFRNLARAFAPKDDSGSSDPPVEVFCLLRVHARDYTALHLFGAPGSAPPSDWDSHITALALNEGFNAWIVDGDFLNALDGCRESAAALAGRAGPRAVEANLVLPLGC